MTQPPQPPQPPTSGPLSPQNAAPPHNAAPLQGGVPSPGIPTAQGAAPAPAGKSSKAPRILIIIGVVILAVSVIVGVVVAVLGFLRAGESLSALEEFSSGSGTITAEAGDSLEIYALEGAAVPMCEVDGPAVGEGSAMSSTVTLGENSWVSVDSFTADEAGEYTITCDAGPIAVGPPVSVGGIFAGLGGILVAVLGGSLGVLLLLIGVILLILRRRRA